MTSRESRGFSARVFLKEERDCCVFNFLRCRVDGKHLMRFQSENSVFKFLRRREDGALELPSKEI